MLGLIAGGVLALVGGGIGLYFLLNRPGATPRDPVAGNRPTDKTNTDRPSDGPKDTGTSSPGKADFALTVGELTAEIKKDAKAAEAKYMNKTVELTGPLVNISLNRPGETQFSLYNEDRNYPVFVTCGVLGGTPWKKAAGGRTLKIKGKAVSFERVLFLENCEIVEV